MSYADRKINIYIYIYIYMINSDNKTKNFMNYLITGVGKLENVSFSKQRYK